MSNFNIPKDKLVEFVKNLPYQSGTVNENVKECFGVDEMDLSLENLSYISQHVFDCECCQQVFANDFARTNNNDEVWCKWCIAEEPIEKDFSEGIINIKEYTEKMNCVNL